MKNISLLFTLFLIIACSKTLERSNPLDGKTLPVISAITFSSMGSTSASVTTTISSDGKASISSKGVVWSTSTGPTIALSTRTNDGVGVVGNFNSSLSGLLPFTNYYIRSYATNIVGTAYGPETPFKTLPGIPSLTTTSPSSISPISANSGGNITSNNGSTIIARGVVWNTMPEPKIDLATKTKDSIGIGIFASSIKPLLPGKTYFVRAYATNGIGTAYGNEISFTTLFAPPTVTTAEVIKITTTTATSGGNVTYDGASPVTARGIVWSLNPEPKIDLTTRYVNSVGLGVFESPMTSLIPGKDYYVRAYAQNSAGLSYGNQIKFTALNNLPILTTNDPTSITLTSATLNGNVTGDGGSPVTKKGIVFNTSPAPSLTSYLGNLPGGSGLGSIAVGAIGLAPGTPYYFRAYATSNNGTAYGDEIIFTTLAGFAVLTTAQAATIASTSAILGGEVTSESGAKVTEKGVVWATTTNPTIYNSSKKIAGDGIGSFTISVTGLEKNKKYYVKSYAISSVGPAYGPEINFTTLP